jgi:hypothetical protein
VRHDLHEEGLLVHRERGRALLVSGRVLGLEDCTQSQRSIYYEINRLRRTRERVLECRVRVDGVEWADEPELLLDIVVADRFLLILVTRAGRSRPEALVLCRSVRRCVPMETSSLASFASISR